MSNDEISEPLTNSQHSVRMSLAYAMKRSMICRLILKGVKFRELETNMMDKRIH